MRVKRLNEQAGSGSHLHLRAPATTPASTSSPPSSPSQTKTPQRDESSASSEPTPIPSVDPSSPSPRDATPPVEGGGETNDVTDNTQTDQEEEEEDDSPPSEQDQQPQQQQEQPPPQQQEQPSSSSSSSSSSSQQQPQQQEKPQDDEKQKKIAEIDSILSSPNKLIAPYISLSSLLEKAKLSPPPPVPVRNYFHLLEPPSADGSEGGGERPSGGICGELTPGQILLAIGDYESNQPNSLSFKVGDKIEFVKGLDDQWGCGKIGTKSGMFPFPCVKELE